MAWELESRLAQISRAGLQRRRRTLSSAQGPRIRVDGREYLSFCSNDYLGLAAHPALTEAACQAARVAGVGAGASHLVLGHHELHEQLEQRFAALTNFPRALLFSTGYMANLGVITALLSRHDAIFADRLNHASLNDAALLSRADLQRFRHADAAHLDELLGRSSAQRKLVVTDGVFSMDGDMAPLTDMLAVCERHDALLFVDDAHGFGVLGEGGRGILQHFGLKSDRLIYLATLGKAMGSFGALVAGSESLIEYLLQKAHTYIYTTALPPMLAQASLTAFELMADDRLRQHLQQLIRQLRNDLEGLPWQLMSSVTPIQPLLVGDAVAAVELADALRESGIMVPAIRPPTVPTGSARLRISLSAAHTADDVAALAQALAHLARGR